jgi:hypothetical protein
MAYTTIKKPSDYFNTKLYTGNGSTQSITGVGFKPDATFFKQRTGSPSSSGSQFYDAIRGATKYLSTHSANAEATQSNGLTSFDSDGFSIGSTSRINGNTQSYVTWNWLANGTGSANTDGSINSTVSANTTSGFSIVKFTGTGANATVGHGLGVKPKIILLKSYENGQQWSSYWSVLGATKYMRFNATNGQSTASNRWNNTEPTTSVFTVSTDGEVNTNGENQIAYCFADVTGYSKFSSYVGNGSADGTFVYTGFSPSFVMTKRSDSTSDWLICDNKRPGYNVINKKLFANLSQAEDSYDSFDFVSNGFKIRSSGTGHNASGGTYIYMAFAEEPLIGDNPATAR